MQYVLFNDISDQAEIGTKPSATGTQADSIKIDFRSSAAAEAGLGSFGIAIGRSGQRYVFAETTVEQAMLYDKALFAVGEMARGKMTVSADALSLWFDGIPEGTSLFVHILDAQCSDYAEIMDDLRG